MLKNKVKTDIDISYVKKGAINIINKKENKQIISKSADIYTNKYLKKYCEDLKYSNNYSCYDISLLVELYGVKIAHLIKYLLKILSVNDKEKIIIYTKLEDNLINNINNILNQHNIKSISCYGNKNQKMKSIENFNTDNYNIMIMSIKNVSLCINITGITKIIFLEPLFGDKDYVDNFEKQCLGLTYHLNKVSYLTIVRFIIKDSIEEKIYKQIYD